MDACFRIVNDHSDFYAGSILGNSSNVNFCVWTRGNKLDYGGLAEIEDTVQFYNVPTSSSKTEEFSSFSSVDSTGLRAYSSHQIQIFKL